MLEDLRSVDGNEESESRFVTSQCLP